MTRKSYPAASWKKRLATIALGIFSASASGSPLPESHFVTGFNQGWFDTRTSATYGCTWGNCYDPVLAEETLSATKNFGGKVLRMWLFEDSGNQNILRTASGFALHPAVVDNVRNFMTIARKHGVRVYWTLFADKMPVTLDPADLQRFFDGAVKPLLKVFADNLPAIYAIDVYNEIDGGVIRGVFDRGPERDEWHNANRLVCSARNFIRSQLGSNVAVTASLGWPWDPFHFYGGAAGTVGDQPAAECIDFYDFHHYSRTGGFSHCDSLRKLTARKPVILGEFGQTGAFPWIREPRYPDAGDSTGNRRAYAVQKFLTQAKECGLSGALGWRLKEIDETGRAIRNSFMGTGKVEKNGEAWDVALFRWLSGTLGQ